MKRNKRKLKLLNFFNKRNNKNRKKSSRKKRRIFASAVLAGNLLFGNLTTNDLKTQKYSNGTPLTQEKVISNQEFNSLDGSHNSGKIIRTGNGTILEFQQEVSETSSTDMDEIILVKDDGILPGADGFPLNNNPRRRHPIGRGVETSRVNSINRGGDLGKSGPGPRAKADALKNARKTGGGSIFVQGFTPQRQYGSRPINKPLSCRNNVKINQEQFNGNQNTAKQTNQDCTLTREQRRNLPHPDDVRIPDQDVIIRHGQAKYKVKNHGSDFSLPSKPNEKGWLKTPRTSENIEGFKDEIKKLVLRGERIEGTYRKGEPDQFSAIHFYDSVSGCNAIFKQETKEFVSAWKLTQGQVSDLLTNKNIGDY